MEPQEQNKKTNWERWYLIAFTLLLVITFVLYLPTWFALKSANFDNAHVDEDSMEMKIGDNEEDEDHPHDEDVDLDHPHEEEISSVWTNIAYAAEDDDHPHDEDVDSDHGHDESSNEGVPWYVNSVWWTRFLISFFLAIALSLGVKRYVSVK